MPKPRIVGATPPTKTDGFTGPANAGPTPVPLAPQPSSERKCPNCGIRVGDEAVVCWQCRASLKTAEKKIVSKRGKIAIAILSVILLAAFILPYVTYTETESYYGESLETTATLSGYELADGVVFVTIMGMTVELDIGASYPIFWAGPAIAVLCLILLFIKRMHAMSLIVGISGLALVVANAAGYAQVVTNEDGGILSSGSFVPGYGLVIAIISGLILAMIGIMTYRAGAKVRP